MTVCHTWKVVYIPLLLVNSKSSVANTDNTALEWPSAICVHVTGAGLPLVIVILLLFGLGTMFPLKNKQIYITIPWNKKRLYKYILLVRVICEKYCLRGEENFQAASEIIMVLILTNDFSSCLRLSLCPEYCVLI